MPSKPEARIQELHLTLPPPPKPVAKYKPAVLVGNILYVSGHGPLKPDGKSNIQGRVGTDLTAAPSMAQSMLTPGAGCADNGTSFRCSPLPCTSLRSSSSSPPSSRRSSASPSSCVATSPTTMIAACCTGVRPALDRRRCRRSSLTVAPAAGTTKKRGQGRVFFSPQGLNPGGSLPA